MPTIRSSFAIALTALAYGCSHAPPLSTSPMPSEPGLPSASAGADVLMGLLELRPLAERLCGPKAPAPDAPEAIAIREQIQEKILQASLDVDTAIAEIQFEQTRLEEIRDRLNSERTAQVNILTIAAAVFGAGTAAGTAMTLKPSSTAAGEWVGSITGLVGAALGVAAVLVPSRNRPPLQVPSSMLAPILDPSLGPERYPPLVWRYLTTPMAPGAVPRELLLDAWRKLGRIGAPGLPQKRGSAAALTCPVATWDQVSIEDVDSRRLMLGDARAQVAAMKPALRLALKRVTLRE